jgi:hypothetical protein
MPRNTPSEVRAIDAPPRAWHKPCESSGMDDDSRIRYLVQVAAALAILVALLVIL